MEEKQKTKQDFDLTYYLLENNIANLVNRSGLPITTIYDLFIKFANQAESIKKKKIVQALREEQKRQNPNGPIEEIHKFSDNEYQNTNNKNEEKEKK